jgi:hypothetical protein
MNDQVSLRSYLTESGIKGLVACLRKVLSLREHLQDMKPMLNSL